MIFGVPRGTQKLSKIYESVVTKWSWKPSGGHFGRFTAFYSILGSFWVHSGPLRDHFLTNLVRFSTFLAILWSSLLSCFLSVFVGGIFGWLGELGLLVIRVVAYMDAVDGAAAAAACVVGGFGFAGVGIGAAVVGVAVGVDVGAGVSADAGITGVAGGAVVGSIS